MPLYPKIEETYNVGTFRCEGLCDLGILIMRACGIPVTVEQATWSKIDLSHYWCSVLDNNKFYSFETGHIQIERHANSLVESENQRPAKVYRSRFDPDLSKLNKNDDGYVTFLKSPLIYDVTNQYKSATTKIQISVNKEYSKASATKQVYLCAYNNNNWKPLAIGFQKDSTCVFNNVVGDNIFIAADSPNGKYLRYITAPFYVDTIGNIRKFIPDKEHKQTFTLSKYKVKKEKQIKIAPLHYWDTDKQMFVMLNSVATTDTTRTYNEIPKNALLWATIPERIMNQRIFFIENDSLKIY